MMSNMPAITLESPAVTSDIKVRRLNFELDNQNIQKFWFADNAFLTCMLTSLSAAFPAGERYFIESVRHFQPQIKDPQLLADIRGFIGQEANHTREHAALNRWIDRNGLPLAKLEALISERIRYVQAKSSPERNLARTAALEHFTAIIADAFLNRPEVIASMHPQLAKIWAWHAVEEVEHRSVAFDVYRAAVGDEKLRRRTMIITSAIFVTLVSLRTMSLMKAAGHLWSFKTWRRGLSVLWGRKGIFWPLIPQYFAYYRKTFHPSQHDNSAELHAMRAAYLGN